MTETTDTTATTPPPVLLTSIGDILVNLARHAGQHGHSEGVAGVPDDQTTAPDCLVAHIAEISQVLFTLAPDEEHNVRLVLPRDLPEGLVEQLQQLAHDELAKMEGRA